MAATLPTQLPGDRIQKAIKTFCELRADNPDQDRRVHLEKVERQFDLTPLECEFLHRQLLENSNCSQQEK